jgi:hypothetical protein
MTTTWQRSAARSQAKRGGIIAIVPTCRLNNACSPHFWSVF